MATGDELLFSSALEQADMVRKKKVSPTELVEAYLERITRLNPLLNAYLTVAADKARSWAAEAEAKGHDDNLPPFHGVPISIKDLTDTAGIRTTHGARAYANRVPTRDAESIVRLKRAGFVILGKTNSPEMGSAVITEPVAYGPCRNPWDTKRNPGGSSGGAAAALAAGLCPISHGSDGGGSIRIPSAWCGLVGLKPSRGRVSAAPGPQDLFTQQGPIARTVADAAAMLDVMAGYVTGDAFWAPPPERPFLSEVGRPPRRLRVAVAADRPDTHVDPAHVDAVKRVATLLEELGHEVHEASPPWTELKDDHPVVLGRCASMAGLEKDLPPYDTLDPINKAFLEVGRRLAVSDVLVGEQTAAMLSRSLVAFFDDYDVLVSPTNASPPPLIGELRDTQVPWNGLLKSMKACPFTADWNMTGQPAISLPLYVHANGLPIGVQFVGKPAEEATLLRLAAQLEKALPWRFRRPPDLEVASGGQVKQP